MRKASIFTQNVDMTREAVLKQMMLFALPLIFTNLLQQLYNIADSAVVGRFDSALSLAAVGTAGMIVGLLNGFLMGFVNGGSIIVAQYFGASDGKNLEKSIHTTYALSIIIGAILCVLGLVLSPALLTATHVPADIYDQTLLYTRIFFCGSIPNSIYCFSAGILRAEGDSRNPLLFLVVSGMINVILNLILVIGARMSVAGVAIATIVSQAVSAVLATVALLRADGVCRLSFRHLQLNPMIVKRILQLGIPASIQSTMFSVSNICIQASINQFGSTMIAGCTASSNIDGCLFQVTGALSAAIITFSSQNYGAKNWERIKKGALQCTALSMGIVCVLGLLTTLFGRPLLHLFNEDPAVINAGMERLIILIPTIFLYTGFEGLCSITRGCGSSFVPMVLSVFGVCISRLVWIYTVLPIFDKIEIIFYSYPISYLLSLAMALVYYFGFQKHWLYGQQTVN